jgi:peptidoglycan DL-endopeptidase CwlO
LSAQPPRLRMLLRAGLMGLVGLAFIIPGTAANADPSLDSIEKQIDAQSNHLEDVVEHYNKITEQLKASQASATQVEAALGPLTAKLDIETTRVGEIAALAYEGGTLAQVASVLDGGDPSVMVDRLTSLDQISKYEQAQVQAVRATKSQHDGEAAKLAALIKDQQDKQQALSAERAKIKAELAHLYELRKKAIGKVTASRAGGKHPAPPYVAGKAGVAVRYAYGALGKPYQWAADGPGSYDCSGLTMAAWRAAGVSLPHNAEMQWNALGHITRSSLRPGDLVFYRSLGHVAIYVGNNQIIHAPHAGDVVRVASINIMSPYGYARPG